MTKLKKIMELNHVDALELSNETGISLRTVISYMTGERSISRGRADYVLMIANALGVDIWEVLE